MRTPSLLPLRVGSTREKDYCRHCMDSSRPYHPCCNGWMVWIRSLLKNHLTRSRPILYRLKAMSSIRTRLFSGEHATLLPVPTLLFQTVVQIPVLLSQTVVQVVVPVLPFPIVAQALLSQTVVLVPVLL